MDKHTAQWHSKALHGQWPGLLLDRRVQSSAWLKKAYLNLVTEALIMAAQDQALCANWLKHHIWGTTYTFWPLQEVWSVCRECKA